MIIGQSQEKFKIVLTNWTEYSNIKTEYKIKSTKNRKQEVRKTKIRGIKVRQGIKIKAVGLTKKERKIIENAMRQIKYERKKDNSTSLSYSIKLK